MIYGNIKNYKRYESLYGIGKVLERLSQTDTNTVYDTPIVIEKDRVFINPVSLVSKDVKDCVYESHRKFIDIHYIVSGCEGISVQKTELLTPKEPFSVEKDIGFYDGEENITIYLRSGDFLICYPEDAHMVAIKEKEPEQIVKFVGKVAVD